MLFKDYHIPLIRSGKKTATRREWDRRQVKPGGVYIAATELFTSDDEADCYVRVEDVYRQPLGEVTDADARREGDYADREAFVEGYERVYGSGSWDDEKVVWVVEFEYVGRTRPNQAEIRPDGGRPIEVLAAEDGLEPGCTKNGTKTHLVDFNSRSLLVRGTPDATDKLLCGRVGDYRRVEAPEDGHEWCGTCLDRFIGYRLQAVDEPEFVADGGEPSDARRASSGRRFDGGQEVDR